MFMIRTFQIQNFFNKFQKKIVIEFNHELIYAIRRSSRDFVKILNLIGFKNIVFTNLKTNLPFYKKKRNHNFKSSLHYFSSI